MTGHTPYSEITHKGGIPTDAAERKAIPVYSGFMVYFPLAICAVAEHSQVSNEQHNPGEPMHWDRSKSKDEQDSAARHMLGTAVAESIHDEIEHATAQAWRSMAHLEKLCEARDKDVGFSDGPAGGCMADWGPGEREEWERNGGRESSESQKIGVGCTTKDMQDYVENLKSQKIAEGHGCGGQPETYRYHAPTSGPGEDV